MANNKNLEIQNFDLGIGPSPHRGFADMRNLDISSKPGIIRINNVLEKVSASVVTDSIKWFLRNPTVPSQLWAVGDTSKVYKSTDNGASWTLITGNGSGSGQGAIIYNDHLIVARAATLDVYGPISGSPTWFTDWQTIDTDTRYHPMIMSANDGIVYGGAGRYIFSIDEVAGQTFTPSNSATYTFTQHASDLILPENYRVSCLSELGDNILIGTVFGLDDPTAPFNIATIFPWSRSSLTFETPVKLEEAGVRAMITVNNITYVFAGRGGKIFATNGTQASEIAQLPRSVVGLEGAETVDIYPGAVMSFKGKVFFGVTAEGGAGVWSLRQIGGQNILNLENTISTGNDGSAFAVYISALMPMSRTDFLCGWRDDNTSTYGIDKTNTNVRYTGYTAYVDTAFYNVGTNKMRQMYQQLEFLLVQALATGQGVRISYRTSLSDSFTTLGTYDYTAIGAVLSHNTTAGIPACEFIQLRIALTTPSNNTTPELKMVLLN